MILTIKIICQLLRRLRYLTIRQLGLTTDCPATFRELLRVEHLRPIINMLLWIGRVWRRALLILHKDAPSLDLLLLRVLLMLSGVYTAKPVVILNFLAARWGCHRFHLSRS